MCQVLRIFGPWLDGDSELRAKERCAKLRNEFLHGVGFAAKSAGQVAIAAIGRGGPMNQLVQDC
jgi:hypothetical protein